MNTWRRHFPSDSYRSLLAKYSLVEQYSIVVEYQFKQLFPQWTKINQLPKNIKDIIAKYSVNYMDKCIYFKPDAQDYGGNFVVDLTNIFPNIPSQYLGKYNDHGLAKITNYKWKNMVWKFDTWSAKFSYNVTNIIVSLSFVSEIV